MARIRQSTGIRYNQLNEPIDILAQNDVPLSVVRVVDDVLVNNQGDSIMNPANVVTATHNAVSGDIKKIYKCSQVEYNAIVTKDAETLYVIVG